ncbi:MAG: hypothetical protein E5W82_16595 [Mesorhizobium sp.]|nr:MAG: hypothetical protein E5W82_16595 [Mesorhizobium sp.]
MTNTPRSGQYEIVGPRGGGSGQERTVVRNEPLPVRAEDLSFALMAVLERLPRWGALCSCHSSVSSLPVHRAPPSIVRAYRPGRPPCIAQVPQYASPPSASPSLCTPCASP